MDNTKESMLSPLQQRMLDKAEEKHGKDATMEYDSAGIMNIYMEGYSDGVDDPAQRFDGQSFVQGIEWFKKKAVTVAREFWRSKDKYLNESTLDDFERMLNNITYKS